MLVDPTRTLWAAAPIVRMQLPKMDRPMQVSCRGRVFRHLCVASGRSHRVPQWVRLDGGVHSTNWCVRVCVRVCVRAYVRACVREVVVGCGVTPMRTQNPRVFVL